MSVSVVQSAYNASNMTVTFSSNVTAGNTIILVVCTYFPNENASLNPLLGGSTVSGTRLLAQQFSPDDNMYIAIWILPDVPGGQSVVSFSFASSFNSAGSAVLEVAGLGSSPFVASANTDAALNTSSVSTGDTSAIENIPGIIVATADALNDNVNALGAPWTEIRPWTNANNNGDTNPGYSIVAYQIITSPGQSYVYNPTLASAGEWSAGIAVISSSIGHPGLLASSFI